MKFNLSKERCERLAELEGDSTVGAGFQQEPCSARLLLESAIRKCRIAQWEVFDACMGAETRKMMGDDLLDQIAELESSLDRAYDRMWKRLNSLPNDPVEGPAGTATLNTNQPT